MKKECFLRVLAIMKKLRVEYARLHPLAFWNYYRDFNVRWMFRDVRRVIVMAYHACQPQAASQPQVAALASKPQATSLGCLQDEEEAEWKKRRRERLGKAVLEPQVFVTRVRFLGEPHQQAANGSATGGQWVSHTWTNLEPQVFVTIVRFLGEPDQDLPESTIRLVFSQLFSISWCSRLLADFYQYWYDWECDISFHH